MTPTPTQIATQAAEAIAKMVAVESEISAGCAAQYAFDNDKAAALILSAAAKMVQQSGAVAALERHTESYEGEGLTVENMDVKAALHSLRSITGEAGK